MAEHFRYALCGWQVASAIALPELTLWTGPEGAPDVVIALGEIAHPIDAPRLKTPLLQIDDQGRAHYRIAGVGDFLVEGGRSITIMPHLPPDAPDIRLFLLGSVMCIIYHQRGILPIHAGSVDIDGEAVAFGGPSGAGKSTLASAFLRRGFRLLADDVTPVSLEGGTARFLPGIRRIRLWSDSAREAAWDPDAVDRCRPGIEKFSRAFDQGFAPDPLPPRAMIHLSQAPNVGAGRMFRRLTGATAVAELRRQVYRWRSLAAIVGPGEALARTTSVAAAIPRHFAFARPFDYAQLDETVDAIVETIRLSR
jgi:hypothetical protein